MRAAVLGRPVGHSLSPVLHTAAYRALGLAGWHYDRHECGEDGLAGFVDRLGPEWAGLSLTMPLKQVALAVADEVSPLAAATGAANTLVLTGGRRLADNTDVSGLVTPLRAAGARAGGRAVVLGAGGTARAALAALRDLGIDDVAVLVRATARAGDLHAAAERLGVAPVVSDALTDPDRVAVEVGAADVVVSTLPAGAADHLAGARSGAVVFDVIYAPWPTPFAATAERAGATVLGGLEMLLHQAVAQVELMTDKLPPVEPMRTALYASLAART